MGKGAMVAVCAIVIIAGVGEFAWASNANSADVTINVYSIIGQRDND